MNKLKQAKLKKSNSVTVRTTTEEKLEKRPPKGSTIVSKSVTTSTEEIENGFLVTKSYDVQYKMPGKDYTDYAYWSEKTFSKTDPATNFKDVDLAQSFED